MLQRGEVAARYDKHHLPNYGVFDEYRIFAPGDDACVDRRRRAAASGVVICEDIWQDGGPVSQMDENEVDLLVVLNGSPYEEGKGHVRVELAARRAREVEAPVAYVNMVGGAGRPRVRRRLVRHRRRRRAAGAARRSSSSTCWCGTCPTTTTPRRTGPVAPPLDPDEEVYRALVTGLRGYVDQERVPLGRARAVRRHRLGAGRGDRRRRDRRRERRRRLDAVACTPRSTRKDDAADLAKRIGADYRVQPIAPMVDAFEGELRAATGVAAENLQARVRGVILMALSNAEGHLVLATGNKSELAVGYSTIYGDAVGGFAPHQGRRQVARLGAGALAQPARRSTPARSRRSPRARSPSRRRPSCARARSTRTRCRRTTCSTRCSTPTSSTPRAAPSCSPAASTPAVVDKVLALVDRAEWKRRQYPPGPKVTALAFGRDRRLPVTTRWREPRGPPTSEPTSRRRSRAPDDATPKRVRVHHLREAKERGERLTMLTAYDAADRADLRRGRHRHAAGRRLDRQHHATATRRRCR